jgi:RNA polymerase sigma-70 factor (ECF subfamily)
MKGTSERLDSISTAWTLLRTAHGGAPNEAMAARELLWMRYGRAVQRYLAAALDDPRDAEDLAQEFGLALVRGDFHRAEPSRGRFRDYVRTILFGMVSDHRRKRARQSQTLANTRARVSSTSRASRASAAGAARPDETDLDRQFIDQWRDELLRRTWAALAEAHPDHHRVLSYRVDHPDSSSSALASALAPELGRALTPGAVRLLLWRARGFFAQLLVAEVGHALAAPTHDAIVDELGDLDLLRYCEPFLRDTK